MLLKSDLILDDPSTNITNTISCLTFHGILYSLYLVTSIIFYSWGLLMLRQTIIRRPIIIKLEQSVVVVETQCHFYMFYTI